LLFLYQFKISFWIQPSPSHSLSTHTSCPATAPYPSPISPSIDTFNWENTTQQYPVDDFAQLPVRDENALPRIQYDFSKHEVLASDEETRKSRQAAVKTAFEHYWEARKRDDTLLLMESLDTLWVMGMKTEFSKAVLRVTDIDFTLQEIIHLPSMARYLSGLLSAYDLTHCADTRLLSKAMELGSLMYIAFDTPNRMPIMRWNITKAANGELQGATTQATPADLTTFSLPFTRLSQITGDMRYYDAATRITSLLSQHQNSTAIPGLWPTHINLQTSSFSSENTFTADETSAPTYAHLSKMYQLLHNPTAASHYLSMSQTANEAITQHLLFRPITPDNASILVPSSAYTVPTTGYIVRTHAIAASSCSLGATLALSSSLFSLTNLKPDLHYHAHLLTNGCIYNTLQPHSPTPYPSVIPDSFTMLACTSASPSRSGENCTFNPAVWPLQEYPGFEKILDGSVRVRSEAVESVFVMWRVSGEEAWVERAWEMWEGVERVLDELVEGSDDEEEVGRVVQTLKYFYLVFSEPELLSLDDWVFTTDGHPFRLHA
jgi:mannosyl-oligosaccharide alpha-1,2-mannosidase